MENGSVERGDSSWCLFNPVKEKTNQNLFEVQDIQISGLPVEALRVRIEKEAGLKQLAYEIDNEIYDRSLSRTKGSFWSSSGNKRLC